MGKLGETRFKIDSIAGKAVTGPDGSPLSVADLPPANTRWVIRRKAEVVAAVRGGLISMEDACKRYLLTVDEFLSWQRAIDKQGLSGLRVKEMLNNRRSMMQESELPQLPAPPPTEHRARPRARK